MSRTLRLLCLKAAIVSASLALGAVGPASAKSRIETGRDLYNACRQAVIDYESGRNSQSSAAILHCNRYLAGLFRSHQAMMQSRATAAEHGNDDPNRVQCLVVPRSASFKQLAQKVVSQGEWEPGLLDAPATALAFRAFDALSPC